MSLNSSPLNSTEINGSDGGIPSVTSASVAIQQNIALEIVSAAVALQQSISTVLSASLGLQQNVYSQAVTAGDWYNWSMAVVVGGIDVSDILTGQVVIDAERDAARVADFALYLTGTINPSNWIGKPVEISYIQSNGARWRRFAGFIDEPVYDFTSKRLVCRCSDNLQRIMDGYSREQIKAMTGAVDSPDLFDQSANGYDALSDMLTTVNQSVQLDSNRQITVTPWQNRLAADFSFDESLMTEGSMAVELGQRGSQINTVNVVLNVRFDRLFQHEHAFSWIFPRSFCEDYIQPSKFLNKSLVQQAVENGGRKLLSATYTPIWPSGLYNCSGQDVAFSNNFPDGLRGFYVKTSYRWRQTVTERYRIDVSAPASVSALGDEVTHTLTGNVSIDPILKDFENEDSHSVLPAGFKTDGLGNRRLDDLPTPDHIDDALQVLMAQAVKIIHEGHRNNSVVFDLPLTPYLELSHTVQSNDAELSAKGVIRRIHETFDLDSGRPITRVELAISQGFSGLDQTSEAIATPQRAEFQQQPHQFATTQLDTHLGGVTGAAQAEDSWTGVFMNVDSPTLGWPTYSESIKIPFTEIDNPGLNPPVDAFYDFKILVPDNLLMITT